MKKETAAEVLRTMIDCGAQLDRSAQLVKDTSSEEEFKQYRSVVGDILSIMLLRVVNPITSEHPDLTPEQMK